MARKSKTSPRGQLRPPPAVGGVPKVLALLLAVTAVIGLVAVLRVDTWGDRGSGLSDRFEFTLEELATVDPARVGYQETDQVAAPLSSVRALAALPDGGWLVGGEGAILGFDAEGSPSLEITVTGEPTGLAVAGDDHPYPGRIYAGMGGRIERFGPGGEALGTWSAGLDENSVVTSLSVFEDSVLAADAGNRVVVHWDAAGELVSVIGRPDPSRNIRGFTVPGGFFEVEVFEDGVLRVTNPGARRIEAYTLEGDFLGEWGEASARLEGFFGCCNPSHFAMLADGRFVTAEKGIPRVKIYSDQGDLETVVATPEQLSPRLLTSRAFREDQTTIVQGVAVDAAGRVLVLDASQRSVRVFEPGGVSSDES